MKNGFPLRGVAALAAAVATFLACPALAQAPRASKGDCETLFVISNGFHTSVALPAEAARRAGLPDFGARWVEVGWGEAEAYQAPRLTARNVARVVVRPGPSAMLVAPLRDRPDRVWSEGVVEFGVSRAGLGSIVGDLAAEPRRDASGRLIVLSQQRGGQFVAASTPFRVWRMCNAWGSMRLRRAGLPVPRSWTAGALVKALDRQPTCGELEAR
ncbi:MAG TPA: DUF2459 domain-containing protein [Caulobacteraceae bacterium]